MRVLPVAALTRRAQIVQDTVFVKIVLEIELSGLERQHMLVGALRWFRTDLLSAHRLGEGHSCQSVLVSCKGVVQHSGGQ